MIAAFVVAGILTIQGLVVFKASGLPLRLRDYLAIAEKLGPRRAGAHLSNFAI